MSAATSAASPFDARLQHLGFNAQAQSLYNQPGASSSQNKPNGLPSPATNGSHSPVASPPKSATAVSASSTKRKKQKIEYVPWSKPVSESVGAFSMSVREELFNKVHQRTRRRAGHDLGPVDLLTLRLSLESNVASEVVPVLNSLNIIADACRQSPQEGGLPLLGGQMDDFMALYESLIDYLALRAFPQNSAASDKGKGKQSSSRPFAPDNYEDFFVLASQSELQLKPARKRKQTDTLAAAEVILSTVNTLRSFAFACDIAPHMAKHARTLDYLLRLCDLPTTTAVVSIDEDDRPLRSPVQLSWCDLLAVRKDVLVIVAQIGLQVELDKLPRRCARQAFDLIAFFLTKPQDCDLPSSYGHTQRGKSALRKGIYGTYTEAALTALCQVAVRDANREVLGSLCNPAQVYDLFDALFTCLPLLDDDFQALLELQPGSVLQLERLAMCLYNLAFLAPTEVKNRIRQRPGFVKVVVRAGVAFGSLYAAGHPQAREFSLFSKRMMEMLDILSKSPDHAAAETYYDPLAPFFGGAFAGGLSGERRERDAQSARRLAGEQVEAPRAEELPGLTCHSAGMAELLSRPAPDPVVYHNLARLL